MLAGPGGGDNLRTYIGPSFLMCGGAATSTYAFKQVDITNSSNPVQVGAYYQGTSLSLSLSLALCAYSLPLFHLYPLLRYCPSCPFSLLVAEHVLMFEITSDRQWIYGVFGPSVYSQLTVFAIPANQSVPAAVQLLMPTTSRTTFAGARSMLVVAHASCCGLPSNI